VAGWDVWRAKGAPLASPKGAQMSVTEHLSGKALELWLERLERELTGESRQLEGNELSDIAIRSNSNSIRAFIVYVANKPVRYHS
jgi:hypothetical protein